MVIGLMLYRFAWGTWGVAFRVPLFNWEMFLFFSQCISASDLSSSLHFPISALFSHFFVQPFFAPLLHLIVANEVEKQMLHKHTQQGDRVGGGGGWVGGSMEMHTNYSLALPSWLGEWKVLSSFPLLCSGRFTIFWLRRAFFSFLCVACLSPQSLTQEHSPLSPRGNWNGEPPGPKTRTIATPLDALSYHNSRGNWRCPELR